MKSDKKRNICFHRFLDENHLITKETEHTFIHPKGKDVSTIDFFLYQRKIEGKILEIFRNEDYNSNVSDHYPVSMTMSVNPIKLVTKRVKHVNFVPKVKWDNVDKDQYRTYLSENLSKVDLSKNVNLDKAVSTMRTVMLDSAKKCISQKKGKNESKPKLKVITPAIHSAIHEKKKAFYNWKENGRPSEVNNFYLCEKNFTIIELRRQIRVEIAKLRNAEKLHIHVLEARQSDTALFHKLIS